MIPAGVVNVSNAMMGVDAPLVLQAAVSEYARRIGAAEAAIDPPDFVIVAVPAAARLEAHKLVREALDKRESAP